MCPMFSTFILGVFCEGSVVSRSETHIPKNKSVHL